VFAACVVILAGQCDISMTKSIVFAAIHIDCVHLCCNCWLVALFFSRTHNNSSRSEQNDSNLWASFSKGDTLLDHFFYLFKGNDVVLERVSPEVGPAGVGGDIPPLAGHTTRSQPSNRGQRKREADIGEMERFAANAEKMATAVYKDADSRELANVSETLSNLRAASADPRFIAAVEKKLERLLLPLAEDAISPSREGASGRAVGGTASPMGSPPAA